MRPSPASPRSRAPAGDDLASERDDASADDLHDLTGEADHGDDLGLALSPEEMLSAEAVESPTSPAAALDDEALAGLVRRITHQDDRALAQLYDATSARVFGLVSRIVVDVALAEEVVEDTYWQVWRQAARFDVARGRPLTWLLAMARSRAIDALRRRDRRAWVPLSDEEMAALVDDHATSPADQVAAARGGGLLQQALATLEPQPRQLIALAFFRGLTHEEIAVGTGLPLGTVKSQIRRALQALKLWLAEAGCTDWPL
ncbi:sigma-70 family RNA polymerase sigma factor [Ideonella sp. DXS29W]|uniref:Sigma-70 family RNA polymerase sigma factor n=1 Tax=Ideonella lacteola TaxID=2984193 RepID=A0ABU9BY23_9BURK